MKSQVSRVKGPYACASEPFGLGVRGVARGLRMTVLGFWHWALPWLWGTHYNTFLKRWL